MAFTYTFRHSMSDGRGTINGDPVVVSADGEVPRDYTWSSAPTNVEIDADFVLSRVKAITILSTQAATLKTNSSSSPDTTISLVANRQLCWTHLDGTTNPFGSVDVTKLFLTSVATAGEIQIRVLYDATP